MHPQIKFIQKEFTEIFDAFNNGESIEMIYDSYSEYNGMMFDYIKSKDKQWFDFYFTMIDDMLKTQIVKKELKKELTKLKDSNKFIVNHIITNIYDNNIIAEDLNQANQQEENNDEQTELNDIKIEEVINNFEWRKNQIDAITNTTNQNFCSGVHNQIMGAGKTLIILNTISEHLKLMPNKKLYIITTFRQEILKELFFNNNGEIDNNKVEFFKANNIIDLNQYFIINRVHKKIKNITISTRRASMLITNIDYLRALHRKNIIDYSNVNFIILDECHSVSAPKFYTILKILKYDHMIPVIGFSATPLRERAETKLVNIFSSTFNRDEAKKKLNIISNYDFINAIKDNIILPPCYVLCEINKTLNGRIGRENKNIMKRVFEKTLDLVPYKKVIGWCRTINHMKEYYKFIKENFTALNVYCSSFCDDKLKALGYNTNFNEYLKKKDNCILLCVNRCREGSDITNVDTAIYLDYIKKRSLLVALQTSGRVLRKDKEGKKTTGYIIDSFVNYNGIQIEVLTANKIINYYKKIFSLCDTEQYIDQNKLYDEMIKICNNIEYDDEKEELVLKIDNNEKHNVTFKLELKTANYDFNKFITELTALIDKMYNISREDKFNRIVDAIKKTNYFTLNTINFEKRYDEIPKKQQLGIPITAELLQEEYKDKFDNANWYQILGLDMSYWYATINDCIEALQKICKDKITNKNYYMLRKKDNKLPINPYELYKMNDFKNIEIEFNKKKMIF